MKAGDFFFQYGSYYVIKDVRETEQKVYYTAFYFYASHPDRSLHIDNNWGWIKEFGERFQSVSWNSLDIAAARKMIIKTIKG